MVTLNVYFNSVHSKDELERLVRDNIPVVLSVTPIRFTMVQGVAKYEDWFVSLLKEAVKNPGVVLAQRGLTHKCPYKHASWVDPWHESTCPYNFSLDSNLERQKDLMQSGRDEIFKFLGIYPEAFAPPNHVFNAASLSLAGELGYKFFITRAMIPIVPYRHNGLIVVPESYVGENNSENFYVHYDHVEGEKSKKHSKKEREFYDKVVCRAESLRNISPSDVSLAHILKNDIRLKASKFARDISALKRKILRR